MHIAYILADNICPEGTSGASAHVRYITGELRKQGHQVEMIRHNFNLQVEINSLPSGQEVSRRERVLNLLPSFFRRSLRNARTRLRNEQLLRRHRHLLVECDVIYERDTPQSFFVSRYAARYSIPRVVECNGLFWGNGHSTFHQPVLPTLYKMRHIRKWKQADHIIVVSLELKHKLESCGIRSEKISVLHNGVDIGRYAAVTEYDTQSLRGYLGLSNTFVIGFIGHILPKHNIEFLAESVGRLSAQYPVKALIVGGGRWKEYRENVLEAGVGEHIIFTGPVQPEEVPTYVSAMDICTLPGCHLTDSPVKLFDYGAAGKPIVAPDMPNIREVIDHDRTGRLFEAGHAKAFKQALESLIENEALRNRLGATFHQQVKNNHTWEHVGRKTDEIIRSQVETHRRRQGNRTNS